MFKYVLIMLMCLGGCSTSVEGQETIQSQVQDPDPVPTVPNLPQGQITPNRAHGQIFTAHKPMQCNDTDVVKNYLKNSFGQVPFTWGLNYNPMGAAVMLTTIYVNPVSLSFSVVEHSVQEVSCIVNTGQAFGYVDDTLLSSGRLN